MRYIIKIITVFIIFLFIGNNNNLQAQFLKNILNTVKQTGQNRATDKTDQITNKALDKVDALGKKKSKNKINTAPTANPSSTTTAANNNPQQASPGSNNSKGPSQNNPYNSDGSFINLILSSDRIIAGGAVKITGSSIMYQNFNSVIITITTQDGTGKESRTVPLDAKGAYSTIWQLNSDGDYVVSGKSSDGKNTVSKKLGVFKPDDIDSVIAPLRTVVTKASDKLKEDIDKVKTTLASKDADALQ
ncbi:MAG: hypothetical protein ACMG51_00040, partial [Ginsengibacter sp.]